MKGKVLVTGSSGTIAATLIPLLRTKGYQVIGLDRLPSMHVQGTTDIVWDLTNPIPKRIGEFDYIIHLAANSRVYYSVLNPEVSQENMVSTFNVLEFARRQKEYNGYAPNIIFSSSREVYGNCEDANGIERKEEEQTNENCESNYSASKISNECQIRAYNKQYDIDYIIFRFSNVVFGHDYSKDTVIPTWIRNAQSGIDLILYGENKSLDFTYIYDTCYGIYTSVELFNIVKNNTINLGGGKANDLLEVAKHIIKVTKSDSKIVIKPTRRGEVHLYHANIDKAKNLLGYRPTMDLKLEIESAIKEKRY